MTTSHAPAPLTVDEVTRILVGATGTGVEVHDYAPFASATSHPLWRIDAQIGAERRLFVLKDLVPGNEVAPAAGTRPGFLIDPRREVAVYRSRMASTDLLPAAVACSRPDEAGSWVLLELVAGVELWQMEDVAAWEKAAHALADLHVRARCLVAELGDRLLLHDRAFYDRWARRALEFCDVRHRPLLLQLAARARDTVEIVLDHPRTFIHGEAVASNILVDDRGKCLLIDWEMAAAGPGVWDLAALVSGWEEHTVQRLATAYRERLGGRGGDVPTGDDFAVVLDACRLQQCLQWLGWSSQWQPPPEHRRDWLSEGQALSDRLRS